MPDGLRVLLVAFEMNPRSTVLGWQYKVAERLAGECEQLVVLTERAANVPDTFAAPVHVMPSILLSPLRALGTKWLVNLQALYLLERYRVNVVFVHMSMEWTFRLAPSFSLRRLPTLLWYAHGSVSDNLRRAERCASMIVTSSPEGFRLASEKLRVIGQGVASGACVQPTPSRQPRLMYVGRVSRRKRVDLLVEALARLRRSHPEIPFALRIVGPTLNADDRRYAAEVRRRSEQYGLGGAIEILPPVSPDQLSVLHRDVFLHASASETGSMDKTVLESLALGCPVLTTNEAYRELLAGIGGFLADATPEAIAASIARLFADPPAPDACRALVVGRHDLASYVRRIVGCLRELVPPTAAARRPSEVQQA